MENYGASRKPNGMSKGSNGLREPTSLVTLAPTHLAIPLPFPSLHFLCSEPRKVYARERQHAELLGMPVGANTHRNFDVGALSSCCGDVWQGRGYRSPLELAESGSFTPTDDTVTVTAKKPHTWGPKVGSNRDTRMQLLASWTQQASIYLCSPYHCCEVYLSWRRTPTTVAWPMWGPDELSVNSPGARFNA